MGFSVVTQTGNGSDSEFLVEFTLGTINTSWITCRVGDETEDRLITFSPGNDSLITVSGEPPGDGVKVVFKRTAPKDKLLYNFQKREPIDEQSLDESHLQLMYAVHEMLDGVGLTAVAVDIDMQGNKLVNLYVDETDPDSVATIRSINEAETRIAVVEAALNDILTECEDIQTAITTIQGTVQDLASDVATAASLALDARDEAVAAAASLNIPDVTFGNSGDRLVVNADSDGFDLQTTAATKVALGITSLEQKTLTASRVANARNCGGI